MTLLTTFKCLLYRYTGQEDIIVGTIAKLDSSHFNTLALRSNLSNHLTFVELLRQVREVWEQELYFISNSNDSGIFQVMFVLQDVHTGAMELPDGTSKLDMTFVLVEAEEGLEGTVEYNFELFDPQTITRMIGHFENLLKSIVEDPERKVSELLVLTEAERHQILVEWNDTTVEYPRDKCVHELFEAQVERSPDAIAVRFNDQYLTYAELNKRANQLAHYLQRLGVGSSSVVGICLERTLEMVVGLLGILKAGGAYVPLDIKFPQDRLAYILEDAQIHLLLTQSWLLEKLPDHQALVVCLDTLREVISVEDTENLTCIAIPENLMYILFTSGSTGKPKGVEILHRSVVNFLTSMAQQPGLTDRDVILAVTTLSFDIAVLEIYLPLIVGAQAIIVSSEVAANSTKLLELLNSSGITVMQATPATWRLLLTAGWSQSKQLKIICGGEALPRIMASQLLERSSALWNLYGPTETTVWSTAYKVEDEKNSAIIGRPIANTQVYILDQHLQPMPIGVPGELFIGGDGLARSYLNRMELTAEKFITDPFHSKPGMRLYRTGDLARFLADGNIEFLGRIDHQVKIRGFRIELGEIETVLSKYSVVREAVVVAQENESGDKRLVGYIVPKPGQSPTSQELQDFLKSKLPEYMVPSAFVVLDALPLTPNNKIDRRALPKPDKTNLNLDKGYLSPRNDIELKLATIWEMVLGIQPIGVRDNFFSLSGNSLLAASLVAEIQKTFDQTLSPAIFFEAPTIEQLAGILSQEANKSVSSSVVKIQTNGAKPPLFIIGNSFLYQQMMGHLDADQPVFVIQEPLSNIQEMVTRCIQEIRAIQPNGAYYLLGHSFEGLVAYEIAQQLHVQNQKVALLGLIDTPTPELETRIENTSSLYKIYLRLKIVLGLSWSDKVRFLQERVQYRMGEAFKPLMPLIQQLVSEYVPQAYPGRLTIFSATHEFYAVHNPNLGWDKLAVGGVEVYEVPGSHRSILLSPRKAQIIAKQLSGCLSEVGSME